MPTFKGTESPGEIAWKIFYDFQVGQSTAVTGFVHDIEDDPYPLGKHVIDLLIQLDIKENCYRPSGDKRLRRKRVQLPNTIGGYVVQKIFKYESRVNGNKVIYTIWRIQ